MELTKQYCTFDQAALIYSYGIRFETLYWWYQNSETGENSLLSVDKYLPGKNWEKIFPAYSVAELGMMLPDELLIGEEDLCCLRFIKYGNDCWMCGYAEVNKPPHNNPEYHMEDGKNEYETEAGSRAECFIWLLKNEHVKPDEIELRA